MIDQKAREIAEKAWQNNKFSRAFYRDSQIAAILNGHADNYVEVEAARLGIIEGRRQAFEEAAAFLVRLSLHDEATAIRALIGETK